MTDPEIDYNDEAGELDQDPIPGLGEAPDADDDEDDAADPEPKK